MKLSSIVLAGLLAGLLLSMNVAAFELKVCSAEDLRKTIERLCMRFSRERGSVSGLSAYGSTLPGKDQFGAKLARMKRQQRLYKRGEQIMTKDLVDSCCNHGCEIEAGDFASICSEL